MSTRRARIKGVAALPPRRKNVDNTDGSKGKQIPPKEGLENGLKSPKTPRCYTGKNQDEPKCGLRSPPPLLPIASVLSKTSIPADNVTGKPLQELPKLSEKVSVITNATSAKNIFASPPAKSNSERKYASPIPISLVKSSKSHVQDPANLQIAKEFSENIEGPKRNTDSNDKIHNTPSNTEKTDIPDDYSIPSVPESITDDAVIDTTPRQSARSAPNPIDLSKNEILSENVDTLFDPIVPLPSPSKVRPKLRPVPRLAPHRRNSVQGSASESEDESRRALLNSGIPAPTPPRQRHDSHTSHSTLHSTTLREANRIRNDSVCSSVSQAAVPPPATSPIKEKHLSKARRQEMSRRMWRRRRETVKRDPVTMYDLIFCNPTTNPIIPDQDEVNAKEANAKEEAERKAKMEEKEEEVEELGEAEAAPVPQIKLGPDGQIILDETSLVIKQSDANRKVSEVVREGAWGGAGSGRYTRAARTAEWSAPETVRFYRALAALGTDFTLMAPLFPSRTRRDLKLKFKKEERLNGGQVDKALRSATSWDLNRLQEEFREEREEAARRAERERQRLLDEKRAERERVRAFRELRVRPSRGAKALEATSEYAGDKLEMTVSDFAQRAVPDMEMERLAREARKLRQKPTSIPDQQSGETAPPTPASSQVPLATKTKPQFATLTLLGRNKGGLQNKSSGHDMATISRVGSKGQTETLAMPAVPSNIETGSLVVLRVNDPASPSKTVLQTYIAHGAGKLTPVSLPSTFLNSVVGYMKGDPKNTVSSGTSPQLLSHGSVSSQVSAAGAGRAAPGLIAINSIPNKRQRQSSYTITQL